MEKKKKNYYMRNKEITKAIEDFQAFEKLQISLNVNIIYMLEHYFSLPWYKKIFFKWDQGSEFNNTIIKEMKSKKK